MGDRGERGGRDQDRRHSAPQDNRFERPSSGGYNKRKRDSHGAEPRDDASRMLESMFRVGDTKVRLSPITVLPCSGMRHDHSALLPMACSYRDRMPQRLRTSSGRWHGASGGT